MRIVGVFLLAVSAAAAPADDYFELGLDYLRKGFFQRARAAFGESLLRAPGQPVPTLFLGVAAAAEGRRPAECARLLRLGVARLPRGQGLRVDLRQRLPSAKALRLLVRDYERHLARAGQAERRDVLTVLAFLQVHDGDARDATAVDALLARDSNDRYARALRPTRAEAAA